MAAKKKRFIDQEEIRDLLSQAHLLQIYLLLERVKDKLIEPQEMKLLWEMVKQHNIGMDDVEDLVKAALDEASSKANDINLDDAWMVDL